MAQNTQKMVTAAACVALGLVFPSLFHLFGAAAGGVFLPMHIPVLLCGFLCGWRYGLLCGLVVPLLSSAATGMPPLFPTAPAMACELAAYGALSGWLYGGRGYGVYPALAGAMLGGRLVSGAANALLMGIAGRAYGLAAFLSAAFIQAVPGIAIQLVAIPLVVMALEKSGLLKRRHTA